jgi:hypothetical protein
LTMTISDSDFAYVRSPFNLEETMQNSTGITADDPSSLLLNTAAQQWMKARLDAPLGATDRIDQNAKQLLALASTLQAVLIAVVKIARVSDKLMLSLAVTAFVFLFISIVFASFTIYHQTNYMRTSSVLELIQSQGSEQLLSRLGEQINGMCAQVDGILQRKRGLLGWGMAAFCASLLASLGCLLSMLLRVS